MLSARFCGLRLAYAFYVNTPRPDENVGGKGLSENVVRVRGDQYLPAPEPHNYGRMIKIPRCSAQLNDIARFELVKRNFFGKRAGALVSHEKVIQIFYAGPARGAVVLVFIVQPERGRVIHNSRPGVNTLRGEVCAIASEVGKIVKLRVASVSPFFCVGYGLISVIIYNFHTTIIRLN